MSTEAMNFWINILTVMVLGILNYIFTALAVYKIAKVQEVKNAWLSWIPIGNQYTLIKIADGKILSILLAIVYLAGSMGAGILKLNQVVAVLVQLPWMIYTIILYNRLCDKYEVSIVFFISGLIAPLCGLFQPIAGLQVVFTLVSFYGYWKLYKNCTKVKQSKLKVESKIVFSNKKK